MENKEKVRITKMSTYGLYHRVADPIKKSLQLRIAIETSFIATIQAACENQSAFLVVLITIIIVIILIPFG